MPDPNEKVEELLNTEVDTDVVEALEKETSEEATAEKKPPEEETSPRTETSKKTEEEETEGKEKEEKEEETKEEDTRFDKHPRWKKMIEERNTALEEAKSLRDLKTKLEGFEPEELIRLKEVGKLLKSNPELAKAVQEVIDKHDFRNAEVKGEISKISSELQRLEQERVLEKYDNTVNKLMSDNKVAEELKPIVSELLEARVIKKNIPYEKIGDEFKVILKQIDTFNRKTLASRVETKTVPPSPGTRGKVMTTKKESAEDIDVINELAEGLKTSKE